MIKYKQCSIWWNSLRNGYCVQHGVDILGTYNTLKGAKIAITSKVKRGII